MARKTKLLIAAHEFKFINGLMELFSNHPDFEVKTDNWFWHNSHDVKKSRSLLQWADVIFAEWCLGSAVWYSRNKLPHQKLFIRYHSEINMPFQYQVNLVNVDKMVFIAPYIQKEVEKLIGLPKKKSTLIYNSIDTKEFVREKKEGYPLNIGMLEYYVKRKRLDKVITIFEKLKKYDKRYKLYIKGRHPRETVQWTSPIQRDYFNDVFHRIQTSPASLSIVFEKWGGNVGEWFQKIGFVLSTSDFEGSHQAVAEGMSAGCLPHIHGWPGAELIYPAEFVKKNLDEIVNSIIHYTENQEQLLEKQIEVMEFSQRLYDIGQIFDQWLSLLKEVED